MIKSGAIMSGPVALGAIVAAIAIALREAEPASPSQGVVQLEFVLRDQDTGTPLSDAWVVASQAADVDGDGVLPSASGTTDSTGRVTLTTDWAGATFASATAQAHAAWSQTVLEPLSSAQPLFEVELEAKDAQLYWGRFANAAPGGVRVRSLEGGAAVLAVSDASGTFCVPVESGSAPTLISDSAHHTTVRWLADTSLGASSSSPEPIPLSTTSYHSANAVVHSASTSQPLSPIPSMRVVRSVVPHAGSPGYAWIEGEASAAHPDQWEFEQPLDAALDHVLLAIDGTTWGCTIAPGASQDPSIVTLRDQTPGSILVRVLDPDGNPETLGRVRLAVRPELLGAPAGLEFALAEAALDATGAVSFVGLSPGRYSASWHRGKLSAHAAEILLSSAQSAQVDIEHAPPTLSEVLATGSSPASSASVSGQLALASGTIDSCVVSLVDVRTNRVVRGVQAASDGSFQFDELVRGSYFLTVAGQRTDGAALHAPLGPISLQVQGTESQDFAIPLCAASCFVVRAEELYASSFETKQALAGVHVELFDENDVLVSSAMSDAHGLAYFPGLDPGTYSVHSSKPGFEEVTDNALIDVHLGDGFAGQLDFTIVGHVPAN